VSAVLPLQLRPRHTLVILSGDTDGYMAPCGCSDPMSGGIRRRISAIQAQLGANSIARPNHLILDNGNLVSGTSRQDEIKAETLAQIMGTSPYDAINLGPADAALGRGSVLAVQQLSHKVLASSIPATSDLGLQRWLVKPPFLVIGVVAEPSAIGEPLGEEAISLESTLAEGVSDAKEAGLTAIVLLQGSHEKAVEIAKAHPEIGLIQYRSSGTPTLEPEVVGNTWLVTPGEKGKHILKLTYDQGKFASYTDIDLTPHYHDEVVTSAFYKTYLQRISEERLLDNLPREDSAAFAGNGTCVSCHAQAGDVWKTSAHAQALKTLEKKGHEVDPDCVGCHVVGLDKQGGFQSRKKTPQLANVGCESCHGAGKEHSMKPLDVKMGKVGERSCAPCHVTDHSPGFDFQKYWEKIKH
jgi:hypothetical protein